MSHNLTVVSVLLAELQPYHKNPRRGNIPVIADSLRVNGQYKPIVVNRGTLTGRDNEILAGNHTYAAAADLGWDRLDVVFVDVDEAGAARIVAADNRTSDLGSYDDELLAELLEGLDDLDGSGYSQHDLDVLLSEPEGKPEVDRLADRFGAPPLSVLSARGGEWAARKRLWTSLGIRSELGRGDALVYDSPQTQYVNWYPVKNEVEAEVGHKLTDKEVLAHPLARTLRPVGTGNGTSVFDPSLTELIYAWYSAPGMRVIDPWAGGSVRGVVAAVLGREYTGIELRPEQIEANRAQLKVIGAAVRAGIGVGGEVPEWLRGEAGTALPDLPADSYDMAFTAPPKYPLVLTSNDPAEQTPVEEQGGVLVKRDDLFALHDGGSRGGKVRSCWALALEAKAAGKDTLVTAGSRQSPQVNIVAEVARELGMRASVHVPSGALTPELEAAAAAGAVIHQHEYGRNSVIIARAHAEVEENEGAFEIPFGMETPKAVTWTAGQVANLPESVERIVVPVGSGMSLAGILWGLKRNHRNVPVLGIVVGSDPTKRLDRYAPENWREMVELRRSELDYHTPANGNRLGSLVVDPIYEAKCLPFLREGDLLWVVGVRRTVQDRQLRDVTDPEWIEGESAEQLRELDAASYDLAFGCPPYYNLEKYSDDPRDLSNLTPAAFDAQMKRNIAEVARVLKPDSFAVFVVGSVRDRNGYVLDMRRCMSEAAEAAGLRLVNDAVLLTPVGTAAPRAARGFKGSRTLTRVHQEVLVYVKGDRKRAAERCGEVEALALAAVEVDDDG